MRCLSHRVVGEVAVVTRLGDLGRDERPAVELLDIFFLGMVVGGAVLNGAEDLQIW